MAQRMGNRLSEEEARANLLFIDEDDARILMSLHDVELATSAHLLPLLGMNSANVGRRLRILYRTRYVNRLPQTVRDGPGAPRIVYSLDTLGAEYVALAKGSAKERKGAAPVRLPSSYLVAHHLNVADVYSALQAATRAAGLHLAWSNQAEASYRYTNAAGEENSLEPDAVFTLASQGVITHRVFLEVDRFVEPLQRWQRKIHDYNHYFGAETGYLAQYGSETGLHILVLATVPSQERLDLLQHESDWQAKVGNVPVSLAFAVHEQVKPDTVFHLAWQGLDRTPVYLVENA